MLRIYPILLDLIVTLRPAVRALERRDPDLARQLRRSLGSSSINTAEGSYSQGKNRVARYYNAVGSLREALACLETAAAFGYIDAVEPALRARFDHVIGTLVRVTR